MVQQNCFLLTFWIYNNCLLYLSSNRRTHQNLLLSNYNLVPTNQPFSRLPLFGSMQSLVDITSFSISEMRIFKITHITEMVPYVLFCVWLISLNIITSSSDQVLRNDRMSQFYRWPMFVTRLIASSSSSRMNTRVIRIPAHLEVKLQISSKVYILMTRMPSTYTICVAACNLKEFPFSRSSSPHSNIYTFWKNIWTKVR